MKLCVENIPNFGPMIAFSTTTVLHLSVKQFPAPKKPITEMEHLPFAPYLAPNDFWLFSQIKYA
jgi:hypothetical protein